MFSLGVLLLDIFCSPGKPRMNAKSWGPLWHIHPEEAETPIFEEFLSKPAMVLGINIYQTSLGCWEFCCSKTEWKSWKQKKHHGHSFPKK